MKKKVSHKRSLFYKLFIGEFVDVITKQHLEITEQKEETLQSSRSPLTFSGIIVEIDEKFVYIGNSEGGISTAIKIEEIVAVNASAPPDVQKPKEDNKELN